VNFVSVDIFVRDTSPQALPVEGVVVRVFNQAGLVGTTQSVTDEAGHVGFLLVDNQTYQLRFFKQNVQFKNPQYIQVLPSPAVNTFDVSAQIFTPPVSLDPRLCRASGFFRGVTGAPAANQDVHVIAKFNPLLLDGSALLVERTHFRTDDKGYAEVDLIRLAQYDVTVQGMEDIYRSINVPDAPSVNLPDLLFPRVVAIDLDPEGPFLLGANGSELVVTPKVMTSDGHVLEGTGSADVQWSSSDPNILSVVVGPTSLFLRGVGRGRAKLQVAPLDQTIVFIPNLGVRGAPVDVEVA
jgi:hypothetical protein